MLTAARSRGAATLLIASISLVPQTAKATEDLSSFGVPIEAAGPSYPISPSKEATGKRWPAYVCAEIQRVEKVVISGPLRPTDRGLARGGLLLLEELHCGIDVSKKFAADLAILDDERWKAQRDYEENMAAPQRAAAFQPQDPIVVQVPQVSSTSSPPDPSPPLNCLTTRFGGGISTTTCR